MVVVIALMFAFALTGCESGGVRGDLDDDGGALGEEKGKGAGDIYVKLAIAYMQQGQLRQALIKAKRGVDVDPSNAEAHNVLAIIYSRLGENEQADKHFQRAKSLRPRNPYTLNAYGSFLCEQKKFDEADKQFKAALKNPLYGTPEVALANAGICARRAKDNDLAEAYLRRSLQHNKNYSVALYQMAQISYETGEILSARAFLKRFHTVAKFTPQSLLLAIKVERKLGNRDGVASYQMQLRGSFPDSMEVKLLRESAAR